MFLCIYVILGFVQKSLDNALSISLFLSHLCSWCVWLVITYELWFLSYLRTCFLRCRMGPLFGVSCIECHQYVWKYYGVGCACSCGIAASI